MTSYLLTTEHEISPDFNNCSPAGHVKFIGAIFVEYYYILSISHTVLLRYRAEVGDVSL